MLAGLRCSRALCWCGAAVAVLGVGPFLAAGADMPPRVIGFERHYALGAADAAVAGQLLVGELNCTSCHMAEESQAKQIVRKPAPVLDTLGNRVRPQYLLKFLADPQGTKPGTTMPNVLAAAPEREREEIALALVHFLATTGTVKHDNPLRQSVDRGELLFHTVGCVACHDPRKEPSEAPLATSIPLGTLSRKYTLSGLTQFLLDPLAIRPGGRMPHLNLTPSNARDIASHLLNDLDIVSGLQFAYYEGSWEKLPEFRTLTPVAVGDAADFNLSVAKRRDHFGLRFEGTIGIETEGDYLFLVGSDDGARLLIDDKLVVNNDGVHAYEQKRKRVKMTAGLHSVVVEYFELEGEETLQVDFEGPGMAQQPLATLLTAPVTTKGTTLAAEGFAVDVVKAAKGREYFASLGCAACHTLKLNGSVVLPTPVSAARALKDLGTAEGCLEDGNAKSPRYGLSGTQREVLVAAIGAAKQTTKEISLGEFVARTMVRFNCYGCHERDRVGGVEESRNAWFQSDMPEMGDEGRIPPHLTGVGAKLKGEWLKTLFDRGGEDRPYMFTRMPKFGTQNVGELVRAIEQADAHLGKSAPALHVAESDEKRVKAAGRRLVGGQGFSCIKCHTFAGKRSSGIQALSLTTMTTRLRAEWFHHYLQNPMAYRPGTRMPTAFPDGQTTLPMVLDGKVDTQIGAIWSYLSDGDKATLPVGLVTGKIELVAFDEPVIYRNFIEGAGTRAIGVGYPEKLNLAFDASELRLALLWQGAFIDAAKHWSARGAGFEKPLGDKVLRLPEGPAFVREGSEQEMTRQFRGYRLNAKREPTFLYSWNGLEIEDFLCPTGEQDLYVMERKLTIASQGPSTATSLQAIHAGKIVDVGHGVFKIDDRWTLTVKAESKPQRREQNGRWDLMVPIVLADGKATIELTYDW